MGLPMVYFIIPACIIAGIESIRLFIKKVPYTFKPMKTSFITFVGYLFFVLADLFVIFVCMIGGDIFEFYTKFFPFIKTEWIEALVKICSSSFLFYNLYLLFFNEKNIKKNDFTIKKNDFTDTITCKLACIATGYSLFLQVYYKFFMGKKLLQTVFLSDILTFLTVSILVVCLFEKRNKAPLTKFPEKINAKSFVMYALVAYKVIYVPINVIRYAFSAGKVFFPMWSIFNILILITFVTIFYYQFKNKRQSNLIK